MVRRVHLARKPPRPRGSPHRLADQARVRRGLLVPGRAVRRMSMEAARGLREEEVMTSIHEMAPSQEVSVVGWLLGITTAVVVRRRARGSNES